MIRDRDSFVRRSIVMRCAAIIAASILFVSAGSQAGGDAAEFGGGLRLGDAIVIDNLTVWPVYSTRPMPTIKGEFITLVDAQQKGKAVVREVGMLPQPERQMQAPVNNRKVQSLVQSRSSDGVVGELVIENNGEEPILVLAGTLLKGGKQDRQVGEDFVVPPKKTVPVSAFCVEHGRWSASREGKSTGGQFQAQKALATKSVRKSGQYDSDQSAVWANVAKENQRAGKAPGSGTLLAAVENADLKSKKRRARISQSVMKSFSELSKKKNKPVGLAYAVDGKVREVRSFTHPRIFARFVETILSTVSMEADLAQREAKSNNRPIHAAPAQSRHVVELLQETDKVKAESVKNKAGNINRRRRGKKALGSDCFTDERAPEPVTRSFMSAD